MALKLDLGCGPRKQPGFVGVDIREFPGVDQVVDLRVRWPWEDASVEEVYCSHFVEHLEADERIHFVNELYRVLKPSGKAVLITPHWANTTAYGDLTHKWPPVTEAWYSYLNREWRDLKAPHNEFYTCDFAATLEYTISQGLNQRSEDEKRFAIVHFREVAQELIANLVKRSS